MNKSLLIRAVDMKTIILIDFYISKEFLPKIINLFNLIFLCVRCAGYGVHLFVSFIYIVWYLKTVIQICTRKRKVEKKSVYYFCIFCIWMEKKTEEVHTINEEKQVLLVTQLCSCVLQCFQAFTRKTKYK